MYVGNHLKVVYCFVWSLLSLIIKLGKMLLPLVDTGNGSYKLEVETVGRGALPRTPIIMPRQRRDLQYHSPPYNIPTFTRSNLLIYCHSFENITGCLNLIICELKTEEIFVIHYPFLTNPV